MLLAGLLAIITFWINLAVEQQGPKIDGSNRHDPDYTMNNFVTTQTDITGKLRYVLAAKEMLHYPDDDSTVLQRPRFTQYTTDKPYTQIEGLRGYISSDGEEIELVDNVKIVRQAFEGKGEMQLRTEKLIILPNQDLAKTNTPVVITQAPKTVIHGTGMIFDKKNQTMKLLSRVKVHYERPSLVAAKPAKTKAKAATTKGLPLGLKAQTKNKTSSKPISKTNKIKVVDKKSRSK
jgi:lipopolysaccharide export system protein LptC